MTTSDRFKPGDLARWTWLSGDVSDEIMLFVCETEFIIAAADETAFAVFAAFTRGEHWASSMIDSAEKFHES